MPFAFAQRALWAAAMRARPLADIFRRGWLSLLPRSTPAKASKAAFNPDNCWCSRSRSLLSCFAIPDKFANVVSSEAGL
jgi:hypothetical protein